MPETVSKLPEEDRPQISPEGLRDREGASTGTAAGRSPGASRGRDSSLYNPDGDGSERSGSSSPSDLAKAERSPEDSSLYNPGDGRRGRSRRLQNRLKSLAKNKLLAIAVGGTGSGLAILIVLLILFAGAYKVVDFAEHVAAYQFARNTSQMADSTERITAEKIGVDTVDAGALAKLKNRFSTATGPVKDLWSKLDKYQPNKVIQNFNNEGVMKFNYQQRTFRSPALKSVTINGKDVPIENNPIKDRIIPGYKFATKDVPVSRQFAPDLISALKANDIGPITRARIASQVRQELGISLVAWLTGRYQGQTAEKAAGLIEQDTLAAAEGSGAPINGNVPDKVNTAAQDAKAAEDAAVKDPTKLAAIVKSGGQLPSDFISSVNQSFPTALFSSVEGFIGAVVGLINPIYKYATPLCLIYDGSLKNSQPTIDSQSSQLQRSGVFVQTAAAQEKNGKTASAEAVGATDWKLADITKSNAERRAGGSPVDTSSYASTQASPTGLYSIADYGLGSTLGGIVDFMATKPTKDASICGVATNIWAGLGLGAASIFLTPGAGTASEATVDAAAQSLGGKIVDRIAATAGATKQAFNDIFSWKTVGTIGVIGAGTVVAKQLVMSQTGTTHNSLATGQSYANDADSGTNIYANQVEQRQFYGAPMSDKDLGPDNASNVKQLANNEARKSAFSRYASIHDPNSLVSRLGIMAGGSLNGSIFSSLSHLASTLLSPLRSFSSVLGPFVNHGAFAAATVTSANTYYGNVQFGYTVAEKNLMKNDPTYMPIENRQILDDNGQEAAINAKYGKCFDGTESIGSMLANGDIKRDSSGNVLADDSLCSPKSLGLDNDAFGPNMVFRWRVANNYNNTLDQLNQMQDVTAAPPAEPNDIHKIKHVVVIMQENRSFDTYFGAYPGADGVLTPDGKVNQALCNPADLSKPKDNPQCPYLNNTDGNYGSSHSAAAVVHDMQGGKMNGFYDQAVKALEATKKTKQGCSDINAPDCGGGLDVMGYHTGDSPGKGKVYNYWNYASNFVLQDHMFESASSWSLPEHLYGVSGWAARCSRVGDPSSCVGGVRSGDNGPQCLLLKLCGQNPVPPHYDWTDLTYLLHKQNVPWGYYVFNGGEPDCEDDAVAKCNPKKQNSETPGIWNPLPAFTDVKDTNQLGNIQPIGNFYTAATSGNLPAVSWVIPNDIVSEHPPGTVSDGQNYVTGLINTLMQGPDWSSTAIFVSWDDWGGFYDHVMPPQLDATGLGFRVPGLVISPYAKQGYIDHQTTSHDAYLKFIEDDFLNGQRLDPATDGRSDPRPDVRENNPLTGDLTSDFNFSQAPLQPLILPGGVTYPNSY